MSGDLRQACVKTGQLILRTVAITGLGAVLLLGVTGCNSAPPEDLPPDEVEELRQEHEAMSQREMDNK